MARFRRGTRSGAVVETARWFHLAQRVTIALALAFVMGVGALVAWDAVTDRDDGHDRDLIARTYVLARAAVDGGHSPFGALLYLDSRILHEAQNDVGQGGGGRHAERRAISEALHRFGRQSVARATLYTSTEPCGDCWALVREVGIRRVVYGTSAQAMRAAFPGRRDPVDVRNLWRRLDPRIEFVGPLAEEEGQAIHLAFWPDR